MTHKAVGIGDCPARAIVMVRGPDEISARSRTVSIAVDYLPPAAFRRLVTADAIRIGLWRQGTAPGRVPVAPENTTAGSTPYNISVCNSAGTVSNII